jgi:chromatin segregation and condensation protein Rec8/ScpA/Scc1 (kleisin family)
MQAIAERKKSQNIGEYLVYMYQMEDLIRSYQGNMAEIEQYVISHYPVTEEEKESIKTWFARLVASMKQQQLMQKGHLQELQELVQELLTLHYQLLKSDTNYVATFHQVKPHLLEAVEAAQTEDLGNEIQICLNGVYGLLLCRLLGKKVSDRQLEAAEAFGNVLSHLNFSYQQRFFLSSN